MRRVRDVMTRKVFAVDADDALQDAACAMRDAGVQMLVVEDDGAVVGVLTERDLVVRAVADAVDAERTPVAAVMSAGLVACLPDCPLPVARALMERSGVARLVVLHENGHFAGVLTLDAVANDEAEDGAARA